MFNLGLGLFVAGLLLGMAWMSLGLLVSLSGLAVWAWASGRFLWARWRGEPLQPAVRQRGTVHRDDEQVDVEADRPVAVDDPEIPASVRELVLRDAQPGDMLWRRVRQGAPTGLFALLGWGPRPLVIEWWLMTADGDLIEAYLAR